MIYSAQDKALEYYTISELFKHRGILFSRIKKKEDF